MKLDLFQSSWVENTILCNCWAKNRTGKPNCSNNQNRPSLDYSYSNGPSRLVKPIVISSVHRCICPVFSEKMMDQKFRFIN